LTASPDEAAQRCADRGGRLCTELEWEKACAGFDGLTYPTGSTMDLEGCMRQPTDCASPFGVLAMGIEFPEWTMSLRSGSGERRFILRGARSDEPLPAHRCAARHEVPTISPALLAAFRCCYGPIPEITYPEPEVPAWEVDEIQFQTAEEWRRVLEGVPELAPWAPNFEPHPVRRERQSAVFGGVEVLKGAFRWSPVAGEVVLVVWGWSGSDTLIAFLYPMSGQRYRHAASLVLSGVHVPIEFSVPSRDRLVWSSCQGCAGEWGVVNALVDGRLKIQVK
ncbi:MAG: hypothetical protein N2515_04880, partial [Deltaproteobacteria bacterium]|nr:hypothetical protein [Deltaproteobacteria bacterium]